MIIRRVEPVSVAKVMGMLYALLGILIGLFFVLLGSWMSTMAGDYVPFGSIGIAAIIVIPIIYGCIGFIGGLIGAALYNLVAGWVGGVVIHTEE